MSLELKMTTEHDDHTAQEFKPAYLLRIAEVEQRVGLKKSAIYDRISAGTFPGPVTDGSASRWVESEVEEWIQSRIADRDRKRNMGTNMGRTIGT
jgi:prophage regulatory protein